MKLAGLVFIFVTYAVIKAQILPNQSSAAINYEDVTDFPVADFSNVTFDYVTISGIDAIAEAIQNLYITIAGVVQAVIAVIRYIFDILIYIGLVIAFIVTNAFTGIDDAPAYINIIIATPGIIILGTIIYKLGRSGDDDA